AQICPRCASTIDRAMARPRPIPSLFVVKNASKSLGRRSVGMPLPVSLTATSMASSSRRVRTTTWRSCASTGSIASMAFTIRFNSRCRTHTGSAATTGRDGELRRERNAAAPSVAVDQPQDVAGHLVHIELLELEGPLVRQRAKAFDDLRREASLVANVAEDLA